MGGTIPMAIPPHSLEAEKSVLGSMMQDASAVKKAASALTAEDFYAPAHRELFSVMQTLFKVNSPVDLVTVDSELTRRGTLEGVGGTAYLMDISQFVPTTANVQAYISIVIEKAKLRRLIATAQQIMADAYSGLVTPDDLRDKAILGIKEIKTTDAPALITPEMALLSLLDRISEVTKTPEEDRIATGIASLDKLIRLDGAKLIVIAARPGVGKSALLLQTVMNASGKGKRSLMSILEMDEVETIERVLASESGVPVNHITTGVLSSEEYQAMVPCYQPISDMPISFTTECHTIEKLRRAAYQMMEDKGLDLIVVDYIQLMRSDNRKLSRYEQVSDISRELKLLSQEMKIPVIAISQLNRQSEGGTARGGLRIRRMPTMAEARDSGSIEQDANVFIILHDPDESEMRSDEDQALFANLTAQGFKLLWIMVEKNRQGPSKKLCKVAFDAPRMRLTAIRRE